jgi:alpha-2-macroglobulin
VEYTVRLNNPGRFALPPTRVEAMYAPESFGESPNTAWEVGP